MLLFLVLHYPIPPLTQTSLVCQGVLQEWIKCVFIVMLRGVTCRIHMYLHVWLHDKASTYYSHENRIHHFWAAYRLYLILAMGNELKKNQRGNRETTKITDIVYQTKPVNLMNQIQIYNSQQTGQDKNSKYIGYDFVSIVLLSHLSILCNWFQLQYAPEDIWYWS